MSHSSSIAFGSQTVSETPSSWASPFPITRADGQPFQPREVALIRHRLCGHPLLELPRLRQLAMDFSGTDHVKYARPQRKPGSAFYTLSEAEAKTHVAETFDHLDEPGTWLAIYFAEADADYRALLHETLDGLRPMVEPSDPGMYGYSLFLFFASPPTTTPFHIDRENNFNVQILGHKRLRVWQADDRVAVPEQAIETYFAEDSLRDLHYRDELDDRALDVEVVPGEGVYIPNTAGHYVQTEPGDWTRQGGVSLSLALTYFTADTRRRARLAVLNHTLRQRMGISLGLPDEAPRRRDRVAYPLAGAALALRRLRHPTAPALRGVD